MSDIKDVKQQLLIKSELEKRTARKDLTAYTQYTHRGNWIPAKHLKYLQKKTIQFLDGELYDEKGVEADVLLISMPPQHGKSQSLTETLPSFIAGKYEYTDTMIVCYNSTFAEKFNRRNKDKINEYGEDLFGVKLTKGNASELELDNGSSIRAFGIDGGITGNPADLIIIDDVIKSRAEAFSPTTRSNHWGAFRDDCRTRMKAKNTSSPKLKATGKIIVIMTRWHKDDLYGRIEELKGLTHYKLNLPVEAKQNDPLGRKVGDPLFPEIGKDKSWLKKYKMSYLNDAEGGQKAWTSLYMGEPSHEEGNIFKRKYWGRYKRTPEFIRSLPVLVLSVDATFKGEDDNDKVAIQVWGKKGANIYLVDALAEHLDFKTTLSTIKDFLSKYPMISAKFVEDKANGSAIINVLNSQIGGFIPIKADVSTGGKIARAHAVEPYVSSGNVFLPENTTWVGDFISETADFPAGKYKDQVDAMTQALNKLIFYYANIDTNAKGKYDDFYGKKNDDEEFLSFNIEIDNSFIDYGG